MEITEVEHNKEIRAVSSTDSMQPRFSEKEASDFYLSIMTWVENTLENEPEYSAQSRTRDEWLAKAWRLEPHLKGVINSVVSIDSNRSWTLVGGRNQVIRFSESLHDFEAAPNLLGWRPGTNVTSMGYYTTDLGGIVELGRQGKGGPMRKMYCVDSTKCQLTGDIDHPLEYHPSGELTQMWEPLDFFRVTSLPDLREEYNGLGYCAVSRCIELTKIMYAVYEHDREELGSKAPRGLLLLKGFQQAQWETAMKVRDARQEGLDQEYFSNVAVLASLGSEAIDAKLVALSNLPKGFDLQKFTSLLMYGYALAFGYDASEFYPVQFGSLGRGTEAEVQHEKATAKGKMDYANTHQEQLQEELPDTLEFKYDERDDAGELTRASVQKAQAEVVKTMRDTGPGDLTGEEARQLWAEMELIPREWTEIEEDVQATDVDQVARRRTQERLMASPYVRRAAEDYPADPIVEYRWPIDRTRVLYESGRALLVPPRRLYIVGRAVLYDSEEVNITDEDVDAAIEEAVDRFGDEGAEIESLLEGEPVSEDRARGLRERWYRVIIFRQGDVWNWDGDRFRYVNQSGTLFTSSQMRGVVNGSIQFSADYITGLGEMLANGEISKSGFIERFRTELKHEYIRQYMLGRGGRNQMTQRDWGSIGGSLKEQYKYIAGFADDLLSGASAGGQIKVRSGMYANSAREAFNRGRDKVTRAWGAVEEAWFTTSGNSCVDCQDFEALGWQEIGFFPEPGAGTTVCLTNCKCDKDRRNEDGEVYDG